MSREQANMYVRMSRTYIPIAAVSLLICSRCEAYDLKECNGGYVTWEAEMTALYINTTSFPEGGYTHEMLEDMTDEYTGPFGQVPGTQFTMLHGNDDNGTCWWQNSTNEVCQYDESVWEWHGYSPEMFAVMQPRWDSNDCHFEETDVYFNGDPYYNEEVLDWTNHPPGWPGTNANITEYSYIQTGDGISRKALAIHEYGHVVGLEHQGGWPDTMNATYPMGSYSDFATNQADIDFDVQEDAREGLRYLYPLATTGQDLAIGNWRYGYYIEDASPGWVQCHPGEWLGNVIEDYAIGDTLTVWFYYMNLGTDTQYGVDVGIYLSTNQTITTSDREIASFTFTSIAPNTPALVTTTTMIPRGTPLGSYWLGAMIDTGNDVTELDEGNNTNLCAGGGGYVYYPNQGIQVNIVLF